MQNKIIAIGGYKATGKSTAANMLQYLYNSPKIFHNYFWYKILRKCYTKGKYKVTSFAYPLKRTLAALLDIDINQFENRIFKETYYIYFPTLKITNKPDCSKVISEGKFSRMINNQDLSFLKTSYITIRQLLQVFGTECMRNTFGDKIWILSTLKNNNNLIISDLRFKAEYESVKEKYGSVLILERNGCYPGTHASEKEIKDIINNKNYDYYINNSFSFKYLFDELKKFYNNSKLINE